MTGKKQSGVFMLMLVIVLVLTISSYYFSSISVTKIKLDGALKTQTELKRAKQALLAYAVTNWRETGEGGKIGKLPCPDLNILNTTEGVQDASCGNAYGNSVGYFPWVTLGIDAPRDESGSCFLYVVAPAYKPGPAAALNPDSYGQIRIVNSLGAVVQGVNPEDRPVAVIIAPGKALGAQSRTAVVATACGGDYDNVDNYLDRIDLGPVGVFDNSVLGANNTMDLLLNSFAGSESVDSETPLNDRFITITHKEIWDALASSLAGAAFTARIKNLTEALAVCLAKYGDKNDGHLPMPALMNVDGNEYRKTISYADSGDFLQGYSGRYPYNVSNANTILLPATPANNNILFKNSFCDEIDLPSTGFPDEIWFTDPSPTEDALEGEYYDLWQNWKDHFFYAVSELHKPDVLSSPGTTCTGNCVEVNSVKYAGIVFFAGIKEDFPIQQQRYTRPFDEGLANQTDDPTNEDDKDDAKNYLENNNEDDFPVYTTNPLVATHPANDGYRVFDPVSAGNDIMFCINPDMSVIECL